jgi:Cu/Ag efflux protein CusF
MNMNRINLLAGSILAASALLPLTYGHAEDKPVPMPDRALLDTNPSAPNSKTSEVLTYGIARSPEGTVTIPERTLRITNNAGYTVYPIIRARNSTLVTDGNGKDLEPKIGVYDPFDPADVEFRGFIGYQVGEKFFYGLKPSESIEVTLPVVFWNAGRMGIEAGGEYLLHNQTKMPNPLRMDQNAVLSITKAKVGDTKGNGVVLWYRGLDPVMVAPADDTEDQLVEWTIRDHGFLTNEATMKKSRNQIPENQLLSLINYDVSNVDSLYLPISMAVDDAWMVPQIKGDSKGHGWIKGSYPNKLGWTGSIMAETKLQEKLRAFVEGDEKHPNALLGQYFGGRGWPYYNFETGDLSKIKKVKIPSGASLFPQSPLLNVRSNYSDGKNWQTERYQLSSGGNAPVLVNIGAEGNQASNRTNKLQLSGGTPQEKFDFLKSVLTGKNELKVEAHAPAGNKDPFAENTTIKSFDPETRTVTLSHDMVASPDGANFDIFRPSHDYAAEALMSLWFSWAEYYRANWMTGHPKASTAPKKIQATIQPYSATLELKEKADELGLVEGMAVTSTHLDKAMTEVGEHLGSAIILEIGPDKKTLVLSQVVDSATAVTEEFTFSPPAKLHWTPKEGQPGYPLFVDQLKFDPATASKEPGRDPYEFAQQVYLVMASMNQIGIEKNNNSPSKFMQDIIGANMGFIFDKKLHPKPDTQMVMAIIRDKIKSVLRGVSDFTVYTDTTTWYPNPKEKATHYRGDRNFNVFNMDPYVWFVHEVLGFSGYGFSVDDDTADIGADGGTVLSVAVTGTKGLPNIQQWTAQAPFGPVEFVCDKYSGPDLSKGYTLYYDIKDASNTSPIKITTSQPLLRTLKEGDQVVVEFVEGNSAANSWNPNDPKAKIAAFKVTNVGKFSFDLLNQDGTPTQGNGTFKPNTGRWGTFPLRPYIDTVKNGTDDELVKVYNRVTGDDVAGVFLGTYISVNGVDRNRKTGERFRVWQRSDRGTGRLILNTPLTDASGNPLPAESNIKVRFFGDVNKEK